MQPFSPSRWLQAALALIVTPALLTLFTLVTQAENQRAATCTAYSWFRQLVPQGSGNIYVFDRPSRDAKIVGEVSPSATVLFNLSDRSGNYAEISAPGGVKGWVSASILAPLQGRVTQFNGFLQVKTLDGGRVNMRESAFPQSKIIGKLAAGNVVRYSRDEGYWSYVTDSNGTSGYIANQFLVCTTARFNLRNGPDRN